MSERSIVAVYKLLNFSCFAIPAVLFATPLIPDAGVSLGLLVVSLCVLTYIFSKFERKHSDVINKTVNKRYHTICLAFCFVLFISAYWRYNHHLLTDGLFSIITLLLALLSVSGDFALLKMASPFRKKSV